MINVNVYSRNKDGNRGSLISVHKYVTNEQAINAVKIMKKLSSSRYLVPTFKNKEKQIYKLTLHKPTGYIIELEKA